MNPENLTPAFIVRDSHDATRCPSCGSTVRIVELRTVNPSPSDPLALREEAVLACVQCVPEEDVARALRFHRRIRSLEIAREWADSATSQQP